MKKTLIVFLFLILFNVTASYAIPSISAKSAIAIEASTGRIIFEKDANVKVPMASTTKIMTAIVVDIKNQFIKV